ncbi:MAG: hypothetical protein EKK48_18740 [Candidatus Melainabacteria bacterium]|nr:MAG: hypothetical protein EKK48_18740 [Candidatus Melainabacteria bacterium]
MSILDSIKNVASEGLNLAGSAANEGLNLASSVEKVAENGLGTLASAGKKVLDTTAHLPEVFLHTPVASLLPGIAEAKSLVAVGENVFKSSISGDIFKVATTTSLASMIPGLGALVGAATAVESAVQPHKKDEIFNVVSKDEWKEILLKGGATKTENNQPTSKPAEATIPAAQIDANGVEFQRTSFDTKLANSADTTREPVKAGQTKIEGDTATHTESDGTVTTQTGGHTEIQRGDRKIVKDTETGTVKEQVGDRIAYQQNSNTQTQEWNTKQGVRVVEENGEYKIYNKDGTLIGTRPVSVIASEVQEEDQTLANGDQMRRHLSGRIMDHVRCGRNRTVPSGKEWDVYSDGVSRTLASGETVGMMASSDAFVQIGQTTVVRKAQDHKIYLIENGVSQEIEVNSETLTAPVKRAVTMLSGIDQDNKLHLGDGAFLTVRNGKVVGGTDEIVDEPVPAPDGSNTVLQIAPRKVEVTMVTTGNDSSTSRLLGGYQSTYEWQSHKSTLAEPDAKPGEQPKPIVTIDDKSVTTDDVITTKEGTTDRVTHDFIGRDGSIATSNGIKVSANNDIQFADGTKFNHDGTVTLADGTVARSATNHESIEQQASSALAAALTIASAVAGKAASGTITFDDIALLQSSICDVQSLVGNCMANGNLEVAQSLMKTGASLDAALETANRSLSSKTIKTNLSANTAGIDVNKYAFLRSQRAA